MKILHLSIAVFLMFLPFAGAQENNGDVLIWHGNLEIFTATLTETGLKVYQNTGKATQEMEDDGFIAAHPSIANGQKITVVNMATGKEVAVRVMRNIPPSYGRIIDLSASAWNELGLDDSSSVRIFISPAQSASLPPALDKTYSAFPRQGKATHKMEGNGLIAAHENLRIGTKIMVTNTITGKEIEVTITGRTIQSFDRIIDLSSDAWQELELHDDIPVRINLPDNLFTGKASQKSKDDGFTASHPFFPIGEKVIVVNVYTEKNVVVTIVG
jgi:rare lipoprotein A (peptidoglycan hydrolase)